MSNASLPYRGKGQPMTQLVTVTPDIERDRYGRPLVKPANGGKPTPYTRCTTYVDALEDKYNLQKWQQRMVIVGLTNRPDLLLSASAHLDDKRTLDRIAEEAIEAAKAHAAATVGTAIHALTHTLDKGETLPPIPGDYRRDLDAYQQATAPLTMLHAETFTVLDELKIGGTPDRVVEYECEWGTNFIADIKTGSIEWGIGKIAMQLAVYAHSVFYDHATGQRTPLPGVSGQRAIIIHLPAGTGECTLHWVDIAAGWEAVQIATKVRSWRSRKNLSEPIVEAMLATSPLQTTRVVDEQRVDEVALDAALDLYEQIKAATTPEALVALWAANQPNWDDEHTRAAAARKQQLAQTA